MKKEQTPLQELIEECDALLSANISESYKYAIKLIRDKAILKLEREKMTIIYAVIDGSLMDYQENELHGLEYYNKKYKL